MKKQKKKKAEQSREAELNDKIVQGMRDLLEHATIAEYRKSLIDLFFEMVISTQDFPLDFANSAYRVQCVINYLDSLDENIS
jgi:hypothetical protein